MSSPFTIQRGRAIRKFPLRSSGANFAMPPHLSAALATYRNLVDASEGIERKAESIARDPDLTPVGRRNHLRGWAQGEGLGPLKAGIGALGQIEAEISARHAKMKPQPVDRTDLAGALLRQEIRGWLRTMKPSERTALMHSPTLSPAIALAVTEAPLELSGVSADQHARLTECAAAAAHPEIAEELIELEEAAEAIGSAVRAAKAGLQSSVGLAPHEIDELLGGPSLGERIMQRLRADNDAGESDAA